MKRSLMFSAADIMKSIGILAAASCVGFLFEQLGFAEANIITVYVFAVLIISVVSLIVYTVLLHLLLVY